MTYDEKYNLWNPVRSKFRRWSGLGRDGYTSSRALADFLGCFALTEWSDWLERDELYPMNPELKNRLKQLNGPNGYTIYKMLLAQREEMS